MNPAIPTIIETLGKEGILAIRPVQAAVLADADRIDELAKAARPRTNLRKIHETAAATIRTVALDSRFFLENEQAMKDIATVQKAHALLVEQVERSGKSMSRKDLQLFIGLDFTVWNLIASRYPDEVGIHA